MTDEQKSVMNDDRLAAAQEELKDMDRQINLRFKAEHERDKAMSALEDIVLAFELPGDHCEVEQALVRARELLDGAGI